MRESILQDLQYALRTARKSPGFVIAATGILALGIGANTAMFSIVSGVVWRPLPYANPERLVQLNETDARFGGEPGPVAMMDVQDWRANSRTLEEAVMYGPISKNLYDFGEPERLQAVRSDRNLFHMLGVRAIAGRTFRDDDPPDVAVISERLWRRRFGADASLVGRKMSLDHQPYTVIGVAPEEFQFPYRSGMTELWIPWDITLRPAGRDNAAGRLRAGVGIAAARAELQAMVRRMEQMNPAGIRRRGVMITPLAEVVSGKVRTPLVTLLGAVGLVLIIACANVANLLLARAARRSHEVAVRAALGAGRGRLIQQLLTESVVLSTIGGLAGAAVAVAMMRAGIQLAGPQIPRSWEIGMDWRVFLFLLAVSVATGVAFGLAPAIAATRVDPQDALRQSVGGRAFGASASGWHGRWLRDGLVVAEIAMSFTLLVSAGLVMRAFLRLQSTPAGMVTDNVVTLRVSAAYRDYPAAGMLGRYLQRLEDRVRQVPGVRAAGFIQYLPLQDWGWNGTFAIRGRPPAPAERPLQSELRYVSPGYFATMRIPVKSGRTFTDHDVLGAPMVIVVNEALARTYFPGEDPVGQVLDRGAIVGVVGDVHASGLDRPATPEIYYAAAQNAATTSDAGMTLVVSSTAGQAIVPAIREAIHEINRYQTIYDIKPMERVVAASLADVNLYTWLIGIFAVLAAVLAVSGVYGVIAYAVAARTQEFGLRMALGARGAQILGLVLRQGGGMILCGVLVGIAGTIASGKLIGSMVRGAAPADWVTLVAAGMLLGMAGIAACAAPARQALRVDPNVALRYE